MPSSFSPNLALELMATGEDSGLWGNKTNNNLSPLIESAVVGQGTVTFADADQTIPMLNGVDCPARAFVLNLGGSNSTQRTLTVPTISKTYIVSNGTGQPVLVKTAAGTGIVVPNGVKQTLYVDGTNVVDMFNGVSTLQMSTLSLAGSTSGVTSVVASATASGTLTLPIGNDNIVARNSADLLTNKTATTPPAGDNSAKLATTAYADTAISNALPPGVIMALAVAAQPGGWLLCNGQAVSRTTYANLFATIGTQYGTGDGSTTFNVPDLRGRIPAGLDDMGASAAGRLTNATMTPNGTTLGASGGQQQVQYAISGSTGGSLSVSVFGTTSTAFNGVTVFASGGGGAATSFEHQHNVTSFGSTSGALSVSGSTDTRTNVQPTLLVSWIIKT